MFVRRSATVLLSVLACASGCGSVAPSGSSDDPHAPKTLAKDLFTPPVKLVTDGAFLYWTSIVDGSLTRMTVEGGATTMLAKPVDWRSLALDDTSVYYVADGAVMRMPKGGGASTRLDDGSSQAMTVAVRSGTVYWEGSVRAEGGIDNIVIASAPIGGGATTKLASYRRSAIGTDLAVTAHFVYALDHGLSKIPLTGIPDGTSPEMVSAYGRALAADENGVWAGLTRAADDGPTTILFSAEVGALAADASNLYWSNNSADGKIAKLAKSGGSPTVLAEEPAQAITVDAKYVYWASLKGEIRRVAK